MTGTIARWRCIIVNKTDILSVYFFRARPRRVADNFTVNFTEIVAHAHAKGIYHEANGLRPRVLSATTLGIFPVCTSYLGYNQFVG